MRVFDKTQLHQFLLENSNYLGEPVPGPNDEVNGELLRTLKWLGHYDEYYTIVNLKTRRIEWHHGINKHLGYSDNDITDAIPDNPDEDRGIYFFGRIIHPFVKQWHHLFMVSMLKLFNEKEVGRLKIRDTRFIINIPVKKKNGVYVFVKQMLLPMRLDAAGKLVSYLNVFTIVDEYRGQPLRPRFFENINDAEALQEMRGKLEQTHKKIAASEIQLEQKENFTPREFELIDIFLTLYGSEGDWKIKAGEIMDISQSTIRGCISKQIMPKIEDGFIKKYLKQNHLTQQEDQHSLTSTLRAFETAVIFLKKSGILSVLREYYLLYNKPFEKQPVNF